MHRVPVVVRVLLFSCSSLISTQQHLCTLPLIDRMCRLPIVVRVCFFLFSVFFFLFPLISSSFKNDRHCRIPGPMAAAALSKNGVTLKKTMYRRIATLATAAAACKKTKGGYVCGVFARCWWGNACLRAEGTQPSFGLYDSVSNLDNGQFHNNRRDIVPNQRRNINIPMDALYICTLYIKASVFFYALMPLT